MAQTGFSQSGAPPTLRGPSWFPPGLARGATPLSNANPTTRKQNTLHTNGMAPDGYPWAPMLLFLTDKFNLPLTWCQQASGAGDGDDYPIIADVNGITWSEPGETGMTHANGESFCVGPPMTAYDATNDVLHCLFGTTPANGGIFYRQYALTRNASGVVTNVSRTGTLVIESAGTSYLNPVIIFMNDGGADGTFGKLLIVWGSTNSAGSPATEIRCAMCVLGATLAAPLTATNWVFPNTNDTAVNGVSPAVGITFSRIATGTFTTQVNLCATRKQANTNAKDVYVGWCDYSGAESGWAYKFARLKWKSASNNWSNGVTAATNASLVLLAGADSGYSFKYQTFSQLAEDTVRDKIGWSFSTWQDNTHGDTWQMVEINTASGDVVSAATTIYQAGAAACGATIFVTGDIAYDPPSGLYVVAYTNLPRKDILLVAMQGTTIIDGPITFHNASPADIPCLDSVHRINGGIPILYRDYNTAARNNPPTYDPTLTYYGWFGTFGLQAP